MYLYNIYVFMYLYIIAKVQNICNLISREEYSIDRIVFSTSILYCETKKQQQ